MPWGQFKNEIEAYQFADWLEDACKRKGYNESQTLTRVVVFPAQLRKDNPSAIAMQLLEAFRKA